MKLIPLCEKDIPCRMYFHHVNYLDEYCESLRMALDRPLYDAVSFQILRRLRGEFGSIRFFDSIIPNYVDLTVDVLKETFKI